MPQSMMEKSRNQSISAEVRKERKNLELPMADRPAEERVYALKDNEHNPEQMVGC